MLEEATKVLNQIKKDDLVFLKAIQNPTPGVIKTMELVCYMFD
jgi:hypothetical protein